MTQPGWGLPDANRQVTEPIRNIMSKLRLTVALLVIAAAAAGSAVWWNQRDPAPRFITVPLQRGDVVRSVITTGTVNPVVTVQVGSYVSGRIKSLYCDYNTRVRAGQVCAKIDPRPYQVVVDQAKANLASSEAQLRKDQAGAEYATANYRRDLELVGYGIVSQEVLENDKNAREQATAQVELDKATIMQRRAALEAAQVNLDYTDIISPVDGVVVSRNVDVGQTVAASFQTPTLFLIAQDLTKMQVDTNVSETDIGSVHVGQKAEFRVEAYPGKTFVGRVAQVRQAPITVQNVVTYDAVINVDNPKLQLLPGMTANARIITDERRNVLRVPVQALRFQPSQSPQGPAGAPHVWLLRDGIATRVPVSVELDDGTWAAIKGGEVRAGDAVIVDEASGSTRRGAPGRTARSPFRM